MNYLAAAFVYSHLSSATRTQLLFGEGVDAFTCGTRRLLHDDELREARQHEVPCLLPLFVPDAHQHFDYQLQVLARNLFADCLGDRFQNCTLPPPA